MKKKRKVVNKNVNSYKIPSKEILRHRSEFFGLWRRSDDQASIWLKRVQNCIHYCEFPTYIAELMLIDRFVSGLNADELKSIQKVKKSWTLKQLLAHFSKKTNDTSYIGAASIINKNVNQIENISLDAVKHEPVCLSILLSFISINSHVILCIFRNVHNFRMKMSAYKTIL